MIIGGIDFETNGDDQSTLRITEIGVVKFCTDSQKEVARYSTLVYGPDYPPQTEKIIELTGLTDQLLNEQGIAEVRALEQTNDFIADCDLMIAHNKLFDQRVYENQTARLGLPTHKKEWLCTYVDVPYPEKYRCKKLAHLAYDHGLKMDHRELHRAVNDVELMLELLGEYNFDDVLKYARTPWVYVRAIVPAPWTDAGAGKAAAQARGYSWNTARGTDAPVFDKSWVARIKADQLEKEIKEAPFKVVQVTEFQP